MKRHTLSFNHIYLGFEIIFSIIALLFSVLSRDKTIYLFILIVTVLVLSFLLTIRKKIETVVKRLDDMIDNGINNIEIENKFDEEQISLLESKLEKFININNNKSKEIEKEKNYIKSLVSDISHQTKTPIANLVLYSQLLKEHELDESSEQLVDEITIQSQKLNFLIQSLIKMSRLESGVIDTNVRELAIQELLIREMNEIKNKATRKNISINLNCEKEIKAFIDPKWTREAVHNILDNAVKYTPDKGHISISSIQYEIFTRIDISDTGIGICEQEINKIFKRFYRSYNVNNTEGIGIGLYLARKIITLQGGYIKVKSYPNKGSVFSIFLPREHM